MLGRVGQAVGAGRLLDAGAGLNVVRPLQLLAHSGWSVASITLERERLSVPGVRYFEGDLRQLPFPDGSFEAVCCLSTLEHVGLDNARYASGGASKRTGLADWKEAVREMWRVTTMGGALRITVPCGRPADHGWFQVFAPQFSQLVQQLLDGSAVRAEYFFHSNQGWSACSAERVSECECWDPSNRQAGSIPRAAFSEGIMCLEIVKTAGTRQ